MVFHSCDISEFDGCWGRSLNVLSPASMVSGKPLLVETVRHTGQPVQLDVHGVYVGYGWILGWIWLDVVGYTWIYLDIMIYSDMVEQIWIWLYVGS